MSGIKLLNALSAIFPLGAVALYLLISLNGWIAVVFIVPTMTLAIVAWNTRDIVENDGYIAYFYGWWWPIAMHALVALLPTIIAAACFLSPLEFRAKVIAVGAAVVVGPSIVHMLLLGWILRIEVKTAK